MSTFYWLHERIRFFIHGPCSMLEKGARVALYSVVTNLPLVYVLYSKCHLQEGGMWKVQVEIFHEHSSEQGFSNVYNVVIDRILTWKNSSWFMMWNSLFLECFSLAIPLLKPIMAGSFHSCPRYHILASTLYVVDPLQLWEQKFYTSVFTLCRFCRLSQYVVGS